MSGGVDGGHAARCKLGSGGWPRYKLQGVRVVSRKFAVPHGGEGVAARVALPAPR